MSGEKARELPFQAVHQIARKATFADGAAVMEIGDVPPCIITRIVSVKKTDFNAGTASTLAIGINYSDATTDDPAALVTGANLASAVAQGPTALSFVDNAQSIIAVPATINYTLTLTGTAATAGEMIIVVEFVPLSHVKGA